MRLLGKLREQRLLSVTLLLFTLSIGILIGTLVNTAVRAGQDPPASARDATPLTIPNPVQLSTAFSQLAKQLEPSVVNITSSYGPRGDGTRGRTRRRPTPDPQQQEEEDDQGGGFDLFRRFFGQDPFGDIPQHPFRPQATGSGVIVDKAGYVLTNFHVVDRATRIQVKLNGDSAEHNAKLIGSDPETDLAVLKIENGRPLVPVRIGNSDGVQVGDWAVAIGSPFGLEATVTAGIISAKGRDIGGAEHQLQRFLQTDAAINPGNSGGPLLNINGEVIGINTAIATESGGYQGVGFALPINLAVTVYNQIIKGGRVSRGSIGVGFDPNQKPETLRVYGASQGVFITRVEPGSPAEKAGIKEEDIITTYNGKPVRDGDDLVNRVASTPVGTDVTVAVLRNGKKMDFQVKVGERLEVWANDPRFRRFRREEPGRGDSSTQVKFGMSIQNLTEGTRQRMGYEGKGGVLVTSVQPGSFAEDIGLAPRDIITAVNRQPVNSEEDVLRVQTTLKPGDPVVFRVMRGARQGTRGEWQWTAIYLPGTLPATP